MMQRLPLTCKRTAADELPTLCPTSAAAEGAFDLPTVDVSDNADTLIHEGEHVFYRWLDDDIVLNDPTWATAPFEGYQIVFIFEQDSTGNRAVTPPSNFVETTGYPLVVGALPGSYTVWRGVYKDQPSPFGASLDGWLMDAPFSTSATVIGPAPAPTAFGVWKKTVVTLNRSQLNGIGSSDVTLAPAVSGFRLLPVFLWLEWRRDGLGNDLSTSGVFEIEPDTMELDGLDPNDMFGSASNQYAPFVADNAMLLPNLSNGMRGGGTGDILFRCTSAITSTFGNVYLRITCIYVEIQVI